MEITDNKQTFIKKQVVVTDLSVQQGNRALGAYTGRTQPSYLLPYFHVIAFASYHFFFFFGFYCSVDLQHILLLKKCHQLSFVTSALLIQKQNAP